MCVGGVMKTNWSTVSHTSAIRPAFSPKEQGLLGKHALEGVFPEEKVALWLLVYFFLV